MHIPCFPKIDVVMLCACGFGYVSQKLHLSCYSSQCKHILSCILHSQGWPVHSHILLRPHKLVSILDILFIIFGYFSI